MWYSHARILIQFRLKFNRILKVVQQYTTVLNIDIEYYGMASLTVPSRSGTRYISNIKNFAKNAITVDTLYKFSRTAYGKGLFIKFSAMVFSKQPTLAVYNPDNDVDEKTQLILSNLLKSPKFSLLTAGQFRLYDKFFYGATIFNPIWEKNEFGIIAPKELVRLPPHSFAKQPPGREKYTEYLLGITLGPDGETIECWQTVGSNKAELLNPDDIIICQSPIVDGLVEAPLIEPIIPFIDMLIYGWETNVQVMKRGAAPILFIKITNPAPACEANDFVSDEDYANMILENWDKDTAFSLRSNMEIIEYKYENTINLEIIEALYQHIIYTLNPASFFDDDSTRLGGSDHGKLELIATFIGGIQAEIEQQLNDIINPFFIYNSYAPGYRAEVTLPRMNTSARELDLKEAELGAVHGFLTPNECRERAGAEGLDEESFKQLVDEWGMLKSVTASTQVSTAAKTAFPDVVLRKDVPDADDLADELETDLHQMIDEATRDIISTMRKARA